MVNQKKKGGKKQPSASHNSDSEEENMEDPQMQKLLERVEYLESQVAKRDTKIRHLESLLNQAQVEISQLKTAANELEGSLQFQQSLHEDLKERVCVCEDEQAKLDNYIVQQDLYSRRWNLIFYNIDEHQ